MNRIELTKLAHKIAAEHKIDNEALIEGAITLAVAAKKTFDEAWNGPPSAPRSKVGALPTKQVHTLCNVVKLTPERLDFVADVLVEAYHIEMIRHPLEEAYIFLMLDQMIVQRGLRNIWVWRGPAHLSEIGSTQDVPDFAPDLLGEPA